MLRRAVLGVVCACLLAVAQPALAAHLEVVASYGVAMRSYENEGKVRVCYDGDAFRRVLAVAASAEQRYRAALALSKLCAVS